MRKLQITAKNKTFDATWTLLTHTRHGDQRLVVQLPGNTTIQEIADNLVGSEKIKETKNGGADTVHEGYTQLVSIIYAENRDAVCVTLGKP